VYHYFQPDSGPPSINSKEDTEESAKECSTALSEIIKEGSFDGYLVACYSVHPLVGYLGEKTGKPVVGIFEASISISFQYVATSASRRFGIVSTGKVWEELLADGVKDLLMTKSFNPDKACHRFAGVETTGLNATELHDAPQEEVEFKIKEATKQLITRPGDFVEVICLGCAGMVGMETWVQEACVEELGEKMASWVHIIDGVKAGIIVLEGLVRAKF
jgi:Asp/Glu/hydantoin racemase